MAVKSSISHPSVNFSPPRSFFSSFKSHFKETLFPDDPFQPLKNQTPLHKAWLSLQYFIPIFEWLPKYTFRSLRYDLLAGITITSVAIPQGISYAKLANLPPIIGLYSSFVPAFIYAVFGSSKYLAVGTVAACSLLLAETIGEQVSPVTDPTLYLHLIFTATFFTGIFQTGLGLLRLGILVDFLSHSTIIGFMGGTATIIILQQFKGFLGLTHFTHKTDVVAVITSVIENRDEWRWESFVVGIIFLSFLQLTRYLSKRNPKQFWISAIAPIMVVAVGCLFAYFAHAEKHGIPIVGELNKGINPASIQFLDFGSKYLAVTLKAGIITGLVAMAEGIAIGRSFAIMKNEQVDGNKEMVAFGLMNIVGSFTSCYLTTGPFSKTAVNFNAGCKSQMSNVVMGFCMMLVLLFLAPVFSYTPLVALAAIIVSAMLGLIKYEEAYRLFKVDKLDFLICMAAFFGVTFWSMDMGLIISVGISLVRALLYVARPATCKLGKIPDSDIYRDTEQYPGATGVPGVLVLQLGSPIYFANCNYIRERILRWIRDEEALAVSDPNPVENVLLELSGVASIDMTGIETLMEIRRILASKAIKVGLINPRKDVLDKMLLAKLIDNFGKELVFLSIEDAVEACLFRLQNEKEQPTESWDQPASTSS